MKPSPPRVLGVLAGEDMSLVALAAWAKSANVVFAADGAADRLLQAGMEPHTTIGDLDSLRTPLPGVNVIHDADQETSDCDKLLAYAASCGYESVTLAGIEGDRLDHVLGTLSSAVRSSLNVRLVVRGGLAWVLRGPCELSVATDVGDTVSLMPLSACTGVSLSGVQWPLAKAFLEPGGFISLSNRAVGRQVSVSAQDGAAVLFVYGSTHDSPRWPED